MDDAPRIRLAEVFEDDVPDTGLTFISPTSFAGKAPPDRLWVVSSWLPAATVSLLYGAGGEGKTLLLQQLMTSVASGTPWLGLPVSQGPTLGLFTEDDLDEMHRRQDAINRALGVEYEDLRAMQFACPIGTDNTLLRFGPDGTPHRTERFDDFARVARKIRPAVIAAWPAIPALRWWWPPIRPSLRSPQVTWTAGRRAGTAASGPA